MGARTLPLWQCVFWGEERRSGKNRAENINFHRYETKPRRHLWYLIERFFARFDSDKVRDGAPDGGAPRKYAFLQPRIQLWASDNWPHICKPRNKYVCNGVDVAGVTGCRWKGKAAGLNHFHPPADASDLVSADYSNHYVLFWAPAEEEEYLIEAAEPQEKKKKKRKGFWGSSVYSHKALCTPSNKDRRRKNTSRPWLSRHVIRQSESEYSTSQRHQVLHIKCASSIIHSFNLWAVNEMDCLWCDCFALVIRGQDFKV